MSDADPGDSIEPVEPAADPQAQVSEVVLQAPPALVLPPALATTKRVLSDKQRAALDRGRIARHVPKLTPASEGLPVPATVPTPTRKRSVYIRVKGDSSSSESDSEDDPRRKVITIRTRKKGSALPVPPDNSELTRLREQNNALLTLTALYAPQSGSAPPVALAAVPTVPVSRAAAVAEEDSSSEDEGEYARRRSYHMPPGRLFIPRGY
jgi:hypothetical protein